jgi:hypothetical protein
VDAGNVEIVELLLKHEVGFNSGTGSHDGTLQIARGRGHADVVRVLLEYRADVMHVHTFYESI